MTATSLSLAPYARSIVDTVREPLLLLGGDLRVVAANASFYRGFDTDPGGIEGQFLYDIHRGEWNVPGLRHLLEDLLPARKELCDFEVTQCARSGERKTMLLNARRLEHPGGEVSLILLAFEDVTERRRLEAALQATMTELERSNKELESFSSVASHDLQEPLRKIRAFGERLEAVCEGRLPDQGRDYLARMTAAAARMQRLINDLLMLARVTIKGHPWRTTDLHEIVAAVLADLEVAVARTGATVEVGPLPTLQADATQMQQLFQNLLGNALKFHGPRAPQIRITAFEAATSPHVWRIVVGDNGIGFDPAHAERIFEPFERLHGRDAFEGTGIGLALCRRIVQRHGGTIRAESAVGQGATFTVHLPGSQKAQP